MQAQNGNFFSAISTQEKKDAKPRIIKEYRTVKEYYPWTALALPAIFPIIGLGLFAKSLADFVGQNKFGGVFFMMFALLFLVIGVIFMYPSKSDFSSCKRLRETIASAQNRGVFYQGEILGYRMNVGRVMPTKQGDMQVTLMYILEVGFFKDSSQITIETPEMRYHPNAVLTGNRCKVYFYDGKYYVGDFELRTKSTNKAAEIPQKGMAGGR